MSHTDSSDVVHRVIEKVGVAPGYRGILGSPAVAPTLPFGNLTKRSHTVAMSLDYAYEAPFV